MNDGERTTLNFECPECKSRWNTIAESNLGALFLSVAGLMMVVIGVLLG